MNTSPGVHKFTSRTELFWIFVVFCWLMTMIMTDVIMCMFSLSPLSPFHSPPLSLSLWSLPPSVSFFFFSLFVCKVVSDFANFKDYITETVCVCVCVNVPRKRFLRNCWSHYRQTWHGDYFRYRNASHANYIDLDLHSRSHRMKSWT